MSTDLQFAPETIRSIRQGLGLNQTEFAKRIGVCQGTISLWEAGSHSPTGPATIILQGLEREAEKKNSKKNRGRGR